MKTTLCLECYTEVDINADVCPCCDCSFEGEPLDLDFLSEEERKELGE